MKKNLYIILGIILFAVIVERLFANVAFFQNLELLSYDIRSQLISDSSLLGKKFNDADKDIVIVAIDNYSKKKLMQTPREDLGPWPWKRDVWCEIVDFIEKGEPTAIMFDMVFEGLNENSWADRKFAQTLRNYDNIILGTYLDNPKVKENTFTKKIQIEKNDYLPTAYPLNVIIDDKKLDNAITYYTNAPVHDIYTEYNTIGVVNKILDSDNNVRRVQPLFKLVKDGEVYYMPSLAFAGFIKYMGEEEEIIVRDNRIFYKGRIIPINNQGIVNINKHKISHNYSYIPISKILLNKGRKKDLQSDFFKNKLVIIGKTAASGKVDLSSIIDPSYTSPEANAIALDNFMNDSIAGDKTSRNFVKEMPKSMQVLITIIACVIVGFLGWHSKSAFIGCLNGVLTIIVYIFFSFWLFVNPSSRVWVPIVVPIYYLMVTSGVVLAFRFYREINRKILLMDAFGKFVSPKVLSTAIKDPGNMSLKSTRKCITVLFCDIKDFSNICEKYEPEKLIANLNELFKEIVNIIFENNGTVDKFIGDCIMAYWGDLNPSENDAYLAVKTALEIKKRINELKISNAKEGKIIFDVKIGINTGEAILGLAGTDKIMSYTALGDAVNIASRLESSCTSVNKDILISKSTKDAAKDKIITLDVGKISVKGKEEAIEVFEPIGLTDVVMKEQAELLEKSNEQP